MGLDPGDTHGQILICGFRHLCRLLRFRSCKQIITGNIQRFRQQAQCFKARLPETALIESDGVEAFSNHIRQGLLAHMFGCACSFETLTKLDHIDTSQPRCLQDLAKFSLLL